MAWDDEPEQDWTDHDRGGATIEEWTVTYPEEASPPPPPEVSQPDPPDAGVPPGEWTPPEPEAEPDAT